MSRFLNFIYNMMPIGKKSDITSALKRVQNNKEIIIVSCLGDKYYKVEVSELSSAEYFELLNSRI